MKSIWILVLLATLFPFNTAAGEGGSDLQPYPAPDPGFERWVFRVPSLEQEEHHKVEIVVGKILSVDCNPTSFFGDLEQRIVEGWGYPFYLLEKVGGPASTLMACPPGQQRTESFVAVKGQGFLQRYNSKLPMVVYVPEGFQVRYRVWSAGSEVDRAQPE